MERFFGRLADFCIRRSTAVFVAFAVLCGIGGWAALRLDVSTSRTGLVSEDEPQQAKLERFFDRFGRPDAPLVLVTGGTAEQRRVVVDALQVAYGKEPDFAGRVMARLGPTDLAEVLFLQRTDALAQLRRALPPSTDLPAMIEGGVVGWVGAIADRLEGSLEGAEDGAEPGVDVMAQAATGLAGLGALATALDDHLAGKSPMDRFADATRSFGQRGVDELGYLTTGDGSGYLVALYPALESDEGAALEPLVTRIRSIRDGVMADAPEGVVAEVTGMPAFIVDELHVVQDGLSSSTIVATLAIVLLCWLLFRSMFQTIVANLPLLPGVLMTLGFVFLSYGRLNLITSSFVAVLLGLGIDFAVHLVSRYNEFIRLGEPRDVAIRSGLVKTGPGILAGAIITAVGFLAGITTEFTAYGELGVITAMGLVAVVFATFCMIPALLSLVRGKAGAVSPEPPGLAHLPGFVRRMKWPLAIVGSATGIAGVLMVATVSFNPRYFDFLPKRVESSSPLNKLEYDPVASPVFANLTAGSIDEARAMTTRLRGLETVAGVQSPSDLVPAIDAAGLAALRDGFAGLSRDPDFTVLAGATADAKALQREVGRVVDALDEVRFAMGQAGMSPDAALAAKTAFEGVRTRLGALDADGQARLAKLNADAAAVLGPAWTTARRVASNGEVLPTDLPPLFAKRFVSKDGKAVALYVVPAGKFWEESVAEAFAADVRAVDPEASGLALSHVAHGLMIVAGFRKAAIIAALGIFVILLIDFRSFRDAALALLPTALGWGWMILAMRMFGLQFDVANIVTLPLVLGVGIAYGVHLMHRVREGDPKPGSSTPPTLPDVDDAIRGTGGAIAVAALTTIAGFASLMVPDYGGMRSLGAVMVIGILTCLVATVLVLPAVLLLVRRAK